MNHYLAIVIGPLYKTMLQARSTREIWAASYIFSIFMREIIAAADKAGLTNLLSPEKLGKNAHKYGAGIYPDKAFWQLHNEADYKKLPIIKQNALIALENNTGLKKEILENALRIYGVYYAAPENDNTAALVALNERLDLLELQGKLQVQSPDVLWDNIIASLPRLYDDGHANHKEGVFIKYRCNETESIRLPSILEIATRDLKNIDISHTQADYNTLVTNPINQEVCQLIKLQTKRKDFNAGEEERQNQILPDLKKAYPKHFKFRHKYIAFILADGDNMGQALKEIGNDPKKISAFSEELSGFTMAATELIVAYGGIPIYAGGDDLLFALPLANANTDSLLRTGKNIFELISKIDAKFNREHFAILANNKVTPSMSYGISAGYYKYPMDSLLQDCHACLYKAKEMAGKHAVAFQVKKHSGQLFSGCIPIASAYTQFFEMMDAYKQIDDEAYLSSVTFKLLPLEKLVIDALLHGSAQDFFKNQFNEKDHQTKYDNYLKASRKFMEKCYEECVIAFSKKLTTKKPDLDKNFEASGFSTDEIKSLKIDGILSHAEKAAAHFAARQLYGCMRFIQFINQKDHE